MVKRSLSDSLSINGESALELALGNAGDGVTDGNGSVDRAQALAFAARGEAQPLLSLTRSSGSAEAPTLLHLGERYLPFRYISGGEVVAYVHTDDTHSIHSTHAMRAAQASGTNPKALKQRTDREHYVVLSVTIAPNTTKKVKASRLLVSASLGVSHEALIGLEADHKNGVRGDNAITNLQLLKKTEHTAKTARTTVEANRAARKASTARADSAAAAADSDADAEAPPSIAPQTRAHGSARPVVRTGKDGETTLFSSATSAAASVGGTHPTISRACEAKRESYGYAWRYTDTPEILVLLDAANAQEAAGRGSGWRDLVLPDGTKVPDYRISYNLVIRVPSGAHFLGTSAEGGRARRFTLQDTHHYTYALGCASWYGPRPPGTVVMHAKDCYENVTVDMLSWGTYKQNAEEALGREVTVTDVAGVGTTYASWGDAAERLGMSARALRMRLSSRNYLSAQVNGCTVTCGPTRKRAREWESSGEDE